MRLLLVDDEIRLLEILQRGLQGEGYVVHTASDGREGLRLAGSGEYDVIVLDLMLPIHSGYHICRTLRASGDLTPVLMLTAKDGEYDEIDGLDCGADDYLTKPFPYVVLTAHLRALVRRGRAGGAATLTVGDLTLDTARHECARAGLPVPLTAKEFAVLETLMLSGGQLVAKQAILDRVWDVNDDRAAYIVEVYVSALRRKVDTPFGRSSIRTVRGAGYLVVSDGREGPP